MQLTCYNDQHTWTVTGINMAAAKLRFALGFAEENFICPKCGKGNKVSKADFQAAHNSPQGRVTSRPPGMAIPTPAAGTTTSGQRQGTVIVRSLHVRKDHSTRAETMAGLVRGNRVDILGTWSDGKNTWAQLGPERWTAIEHGGEPMIKLDE